MRHGPARGFTLVETAIVVVVISLILSAVIPLIVTSRLNAAINGTREKEQAIKRALVAFVARNGRLPCPAAPGLAAAAPLYGQEVYTNPGLPLPAVPYFPCAAGGVPALPAVLDGGGNPINMRGIVPWATLGLPDDAGLDAWGHRFSYQVQTVATDLSTPPNPMPLALIAQADAAQINITNTAGGAPIVPAPIVAVVISHGANGAGAFLPQTGLALALPPAANADERQNAVIAPPSTSFVQRDFSNAAVNPYDDIVLAIAQDDLTGPLTTSEVVVPVQKTVRDGLKSLATSLALAMAQEGGGTRYYIPAPVGAGAVPCANFTVAVCWTGTVSQGAAGIPGGFVVASAPPQLPVVGGIVQDPWGNPIRLTVGINLTPPLAGPPAQRLNNGTPVTPVLPAGSPPIGGNIAVQLWSIGPDKAAAGLLPADDDIVVTVTGNDLTTGLVNANAPGFGP